MKNTTKEERERDIFGIKSYIHLIIKIKGENSEEHLKRERKIKGGRGYGTLVPYRR